MAILVLFTVILPYQITAMKAPPTPYYIKLHKHQEQEIHEVKEKIVTVEEKIGSVEKSIHSVAEGIRLLAKSLANFAKGTSNKQFFSPELFKLLNFGQQKQKTKTKTKNKNIAI